MSGQTDSQVDASLTQVAKSHFSAPVPRKTIATFISDYEFEIEYECDFRISKQLRFQRSRSSLLLTIRYTLLDGVVCSIVGYFYESRRILASP